jgi:hypothetical protein
MSAAPSFSGAASSQRQAARASVATTEAARTANLMLFMGILLVGVGTAYFFYQSLVGWICCQPLFQRLTGISLRHAPKAAAAAIAIASTAAPVTPRTTFSPRHDGVYHISGIPADALTFKRGNTKLPTLRLNGAKMQRSLGSIGPETTARAIARINAGSRNSALVQLLFPESPIPPPIRLGHYSEAIALRGRLSHAAQIHLYTITLRLF